MLEFEFSSHGAGMIHAYRWEPEGQPRGVVQIIHGIAEYVPRYAGFAAFLNAHGLLVTGEDHMGHGKSHGTEPCHFSGGWCAAVDDSMELLRRTQRDYPGVPYFVLGHSMGSFLTRTYLIRWPGTVDGAVLSGTGQEKAPLVAFGRLLAGGLAALKGPDYVSPLIYELSLGAYNKKFQPARTRADWLSRDRDMVDANLNDPLCAFQPTVSMFRDMMEGLQFIASKKNLSKMDVDTPIYFLSGDQDPVGSMGRGVRKVEAMFRSAGCRDVTVKLYPGGRHEMFNELNRQEVMEDLLVWLEQRLFD